MLLKVPIIFGCLAIAFVAKGTSESQCQSGSESESQCECESEIESDSATRFLECVPEGF